MIMNTSKIIKAYIGAGTYSTTEPITQGDYGYILQIEGAELPAIYRVDFSNDRHKGEALPVYGNENGAEIPEELIATGKNIFAFYYYIEEGFGKTAYTWKIPNDTRAQNGDREPAPSQQDSIDQLIVRSNEAVTSAEQSASEADQSAQNASQEAGRAERARTGAETAQRKSEEAQESAEGAKDDASESERKAKGYAETASAKADAITGLTATATTLPDGSQASASYDAQTGIMSFGIPKGTDGTDGVSPTVTITPITGGHRITITDADGEHSADVMDGTGSVEDVQIKGTSIVEDGVANVPTASASRLGVVKTSNANGIYVNSDGALSISEASSANVKTGTNIYKPITPHIEHEATFYGLAKSAGDTTQSQSSNAVGSYTEDAKSAISEMFNGSVAVSGTTPTITAKSGIRYVCGEVATLDFTPSASGICDVVFTSGSTATVLTITPPTGVTLKWANGFDPTSLEANTTYEINIMDGLGVCCAWT